MQIECNNTVEFVDGWDAAALRGSIMGARRIVLTAHTNADGDAVGSLTAMYAILSRVTDAELTPMLPDGCPDDLLWLPHTDVILNAKHDGDRCREAIAGADLIVCMDVSSLDRTGHLADWLKASTAPKILFDHHIDPARGSFDIVVSDPDISSTCELIFWAISIAYGREAIGSDAAKSLFTGLCTDTGTFSYSNRQKSLYLAAAELSQMGIDPMDINRQIKNVFTVNRLKFFGYAMNELLEVYPEQEAALMVIRKADMERFGVESAELTGLINEVMKLRAVDCAVLVREEDDKVRLSLRSKCHTDVNQLASSLFAGGGHTRAAGATSHLSLVDTVKRVKKHLSLLMLTVIACFTMASCGDVPVVDVQAPAEPSLKENLINANRHIAHSEETQIDSYVSRRGWQMERLAGGARVMVTRRGNGPKVGFEDLVTLRYRVEAINGAVVYDQVTDTIVAGRMQPTRGLDAAVRTLAEGSKAIVILPSEQAYGVAGDGDRVASRMILVCDVEVTRVKKTKK